MEEENKEVQEKKETQKRQIIIETDGNNVYLVKSEVAGRIELVGILNLLLEHFSKIK